MLWRVIKFTESDVVLKNEIGEEARWPRQNWPDEWQIGDQLEISLSRPNGGADLQRQRDIIQAIVQPKQQ